jgi:hypothetical protein
MMPATLRNGYGGKRFCAIVTTEVTIPFDAGLWSSRELCSVASLDSGVRG